MPETQSPSSNVGTVTAVLAMALQALTAKVVVILAMLMSGGLFAWAMGKGDWVALATASSFAILVFLPVLWRQTHANQDG